MLGWRKSDTRINAPDAEIVKEEIVPNIEQKMNSLDRIHFSQCKRVIYESLILRYLIVLFKVAKL